MKPSTIQLLKDNPEAFKEVVMEYVKKSHPFIWTDDKCWERHYSRMIRPDWEILEFGSTRNPIHFFPLNKNGKYVGHTLSTLKEMLSSLERGQVYIHSVRRSDGEVFKKDETILLGSDKKYTLTGFEIENGHMFIKIRRENDFGDISSGRTYLSEAVKLKPLFKPEDGKPVYKGDKVTPVFTEEGHGFIPFTTNPQWWKAESCDLHPYIKYFSTQEAAEQWVEEHRPSVSIAQIREFAEKDLPFQTVEALLLHLKSKK